VTLQCSSNVTNSVLVWYTTLCVTTTSSIADCRNDRVYTGYDVLGPFSPRFHVTPVNNAIHVTRDLNIDSTHLTDAGVYLCAEEGGPDIPDVQSSSAQLIVLGIIIGSRALSFSGPLLSVSVEFCLSVCPQL